jgi:hypothetical protein
MIRPSRVGTYVIRAAESRCIAPAPRKPPLGWFPQRWPSQRDRDAARLLLALKRPSEQQGEVG